MGVVPELNNCVCQIAPTRLLLQPLNVKIYPKCKFRGSIRLVVLIELSPKNRRTLRYLSEGLAQQIVFRPKFPVKGHFVGVSGLRDSINANAAYAEPSKQLSSA